MTDSLSSTDLETLASVKTDKEADELLQRLCKSDQECWKQFRQALLLAATIHGISQEFLKEEAQKALEIEAQKAKDEIIKTFDQDLYTAQKSQLNLLASIQACHNEVLLNKQNFIKNEKVAVYYPVNSQYSYVSGYRKDKPMRFSEFSESELKKMIETAVFMGVDPRMALAISFMETTNKPSTLNFFMHDSAILAELGCPAGQRTVTNSLLAAKLKALVQNDSKQPAASGTSWLCNGKDEYADKVADLSPLDISDKPDPKRKCCLKLPWKSENIYMETMSIRNGLTLAHIGRLQSGKQSSSKAPEYQLQAFLGSSHCTGSGMTAMLAPFRLGVDSYQSPTYGLQAMDFMLNSIMTNPVISALIDEAEKAAGKKPPSLLCKNHKPGVYTIDTSQYFKKHGSTQRMQDIYKKFKTGVTWDQLTHAEKTVLTSEFTNPLSAVSKRLSRDENLNPPEFMRTGIGFGMSWPPSEEDDKKSKKDLDAFARKAYQIYFTKAGYYDVRKTVEGAAIQDTDYTWKPYTDLEIEALGKNVIEQKTNWPGE